MSESLSRKRARLRSLLETRESASAVPEIERRGAPAAPGELEPLSFAQQGLWFVCKLEGPNPAYNVPVIVRFAGALDAAALSRALTALVERHESLRTRFVERGGVPHRTIAEPAPVRLEPRKVAEEGAQAGPAAEALYRREATRPFDVADGSLVRAALFEEAPDRFVLVFTMHHAISDAWSVGVFLRELVTLYGGGAPDPLPVTYGDYVDWERSWLEGGVLAEQLDYWKDRLEDLPPLLPLPTDRPRPEVQSSHGETVELAPPEGLLEELKRLGTGAGCSLFVTLTAALALLLHRYSSQRDLAIGTGVANRRRPELEGLIGYFVNTLVLRTRVEPEESFAALLGATREVVQGGLAHRDAPYHRVVEHVRPDRATGHTPFLQVMLTLQNVPYERSVALPGLTLEAEVPASGAAKFDLSIALQQEGGELRGQIEYRSDLFDRATVERLAGQYVRLLREVVARPEAPVWSHDLLGAAERRMLSVEWSGAGRLGAGSGDRDAGVYALFEERARAHPESVALVDGDRSLTYGALSRRAERLADHLRERGVAPDALVGICAERSLEMVVGILGVLAADAAYLPLDPDNPVERTRFALREAEAELVLTTAAMAPKVPVAGDRLVLLDLPDLDTLPDRPAGEPPRRADRGGSALAYVMYTSGSTGEPKGVAVEHRGIVRLVREPDWIELDRDTVTLQHSPPSFDASTLELWAPLLNGGRLVLRREDSADVEDLARQVARHRVDTLWLTAGVLPLWVPHHPAGSAPDGTGAGLRYLLAGGDVVPPGAVREIYARDPRVVVINGYGPTENTTFSCCHPVPRDARTDGGLPIGRPIRGSSATVLDEHLQLVPVGGVGQLFVGGAGVARGYLRRPGLTAERFVPSPVPGEDGGAADRLYRTGDSVRWTNDGVLEFLGRTDNQVKVRGFRIELEEIEVQLVGLPEVELGAVVLRDDPGLGKRIVAYAVVGERPEGEERASTIARLKESMRRRVPEYMVPALFVLCDHLPLTPNGKVDRRALPDPGEEDLPRSDYRPPSTATERALCAIWEEVLQVERVGLDDDFFDLGGHSLLATQLVARVRERLGRGLPLAELFQGPTVAGVAARLAGEPEAGGGPAGPESLPELVPDPATRHEPFPMTGVQQAYCFGRYGAFELGNVATHAYVEMDLRDLDVARLERAWNALVRRHDMLRAVFSSADGTQRILPEVPDYEVVCEDLRGLPPEEAEERLGRTRGRMSHQVFALDEWPLFEVRATRLSDRRVRLHFSVDALPSDASSAMIIVRELDRLYEDPEARLPELGISFRDYVLAFDRIRESPLYEASRDYWSRRVEELPSAPELALARDPATIDRPRFERRYCVVEPARWRRLREIARAAGITPSGLLVAAFARVLARWSKSSRFTLNLTLFNRLPLHAQVDDLVGDFTSLILLEIDGRPGQSLTDFGRSIQARLWEDMEHRYFDGVEALRLLGRRSRGAGQGKPTLMPVVFTSALGLERRDGEDRRDAGRAGRGDGPLARALADPWAAESFGITQTSQVWLDNVVSEVQGALTVTWDALGELFPEGALDAMFDAYRRLLNGLATGEAIPTDPCRVGLPEAQAAVRRAVNDTAVPLPGGLLQDGFRARAREHPERPAVLCGETVLGYGDLARRARGIAHALRERGARPGELVAVVMDKGWEQVAAVLGVLDSGAAYLPIDAALPPERVALLLAQGEARIALTQPWVEARTAWPEGLEVLTVPARPDARPEWETDDEIVSPARPDDLAYVIFTSGSTGTPKGVMIDHRGALNTVADVNRRFGVGPDDRVLGLSSMSFDLSVYDVFGVLGAGGALVLPEAGRARDAAHWADLVEAHGVTLWNTVPTLAQLYAEELARSNGAGRSGRGRSVRLVLMSGDWIPLQLPGRLREHCPDARLVSLGGATEASIWSIFHDIGTLDESWSSVPYGRPLANQRFHVLGDDLAPCPDWVVGELYIAGDGLALGYWRDEDKTRRSFIHHPDTGERLYRTGDLGRTRPDGTIEFLGREDSQVKVFGHRIELGEIEAALARHERIAAAAVTVAGERTERRLVAYVVPAGAGGDGDGSGDGSGDPGALITDPARQVAFKLEQRGLRTFPDGVDAVPLTGAGPDPPALALRIGASLREPAEAGRAPLGLDALGRWLGCLAQTPVEDHAIPKRAYPSAGSLYPVQVYCRVRDGAVTGLPGGCYYHDPAGHRLVRLSGEGAPAEPAGEGFLVALVAARDAVAPIYGTLAERFSALEAGHLLALLAAAAPDRGVAFPIPADPDEDAVRRAFRLEDDHRILGCWAGGAAVAPAPPADDEPFPVLARQSYREFPAGSVAAEDLLDLLAATPDEGPSIHLHVRASGGSRSGAGPDGDPGAGPEVGLEMGFYRFDRAARRLVRTAEPDDALVTAAHAAANREIHARSTVSLFLVSGSDGADDLLAAGALGQALMHLAPRHGVGLCPLGRVDGARILEALDVPAPAALTYCFAGGGVTAEQTRRWPPDDAGQAADGIEELRAYLRERLPGYMVPSVFVPLERMPLTANGKVDRDALPEVSGVVSDGAGFEAPRTEVEERIARRWREMLEVERVGVHDNFFDLGGNSLSATRIVSALRSEFPGDAERVSIETFFENPTVAAVAELIALERDARLLTENRARTAQGADWVEEGEI